MANRSFGRGCSTGWEFVPANRGSCRYRARLLHSDHRPLTGTIGHVLALEVDPKLAKQARPAGIRNVQLETVDGGSFDPGPAYVMVCRRDASAAPLAQHIAARRTSAAAADATWRPGPCVPC